MASLFLWYFFCCKVNVLEEDMNISDIKINPLTSLSNSKVINTEEEIVNNVKVDKYVKCINEDFNISNPYNFKNNQEKNSVKENNEFNVEDLQALLFHTTFQTDSSTLDEDLLSENEKVKKQLEEQLNILLEQGDLDDEKTIALIKELQEKILLLEEYGNQELLTKEKLQELVENNKDNTNKTSSEDIEKLI